MKTLGIHSFVWTGGTTQENLEGAMEKSAALGYGLIEFPRLDPSKFDVAWLAKRLEDYNLKVVVTMGLPLDSDISSEDADSVKRGEQVLDDAVKVTRDLGGEKLGGIIFSAHTKYFRMPTKKGWHNSVDVMSRVAERAKTAGVSMNLEIVNRFESNLLNTTAQGLAYIEATGSDNVFLHLDTFHMNIEETNTPAALKLAGKRLGYFHIGENYRGYLGTGTIDFPAVFDALVEMGYDDYITFESFSTEVVDEDLSITCGIWRDTWVDNVEVARLAKAFIEARYDEAKRKALITRSA
ncbi:sugar phosphate isomerase/epimerase family protein [Devosia submarina]|uniref:sugar phosphate isomerase/epimerase family protein n=1 Tax=Devosia submarina TaxID=1173082 RepID=UPI000D3B567C|nr:sugar phosphate isomerase/epimerase [Devosia submarina]